MATTNDITGDSIQTGVVSDAYRDNYDLIWGKKKVDNTGTSKNEYYDILKTEDAIAEDEAFAAIEKRNQ